MIPTQLDPPLALFLDVDGTLIDIAPRPEAVQVPTTLVDALRTINAKLDGALALVSGRTIANLDSLFQPLRLRASGVHGAELRLAPDEPVSAAGSRLPTALVQHVRNIAAQHAGTLVEDKDYSLAVHYRANPAAGPSLGESLRVAAANAGLHLLPGHMVFEIKGAGFDKGSAIAVFMQQPPFAGRRPVFVGDDVTDLPGFEAVLGRDGSAISVTTPRGLSDHFASPAEVRAWLTTLAGLEA